MVTMAFNYPKTAVKFKKIPDETEVVNNDTREKFEQIGIIK